MIYIMWKGEMETYKLSLKATKLYGSGLWRNTYHNEKVSNVNNNVNQRIV